MHMRICMGNTWRKLSDQMRKLVCFLLAVSLAMPLTSHSFADEIEKPQYGAVKVEYSDAQGSTEYLDVMVQDGHVYADANVLSERLGYNCKREGNIISIYSENAFTYVGTPLLSVHFKVNSSDVSYNPMFGAEYLYTAPTPCIENDKGIWIPLQYTIVLLGGSSNIPADTLIVQMPHENVLSVAARIANNSSLFSFDWIDDLGYSETAVDVAGGAARIVTLFNGLLEFDGSAWLSLVDWNAFDRKFGKSVAMMFSTNSADELKQSIEQVETLLDVFSPDGQAGKMLRNKQLRAGDDVSAWKTACEEYLELLEKGSGSPKKYNLLYQQYERALDDQSLFAKLGGDDVITLQNELFSGTALNALDVASKVGTAVCYFSEFQLKDDYKLSVLSHYIDNRIPTDAVPEATIRGMKKYIDSVESAGWYLFSRFLEENALELIVDKTGLDAYLGGPANILLLAWDIMSAQIPFYSEGLKAIEQREISNYALMLQNDAYANLTNLMAKLKSETAISRQDCIQLSEYCYVYLKASYIARSAAIGALKSTSQDFQEQIWEKLADEEEINQIIARNLAILSSADEINNCYILGFLPENNEEYLQEDHDQSLLSAVMPEDELPEAGPQLSQVNVYHAGQLERQYLFTYNDNLLTEVKSSYSDGSMIRYTFQYDAENRLIYTEREDAFSTLCTSSYTYDENGKLNQWTEAEGGRITYQCEYDAHQRLSKAVGTTDGGVYTHSYTYNDNGQITQEAVVIQSNGENISYDVWYTYNESGKLSSTWGDYNGGTTQTTYSYDYAPFILAENSRLMSGYSLETLRSLYLRDRENHTIFSLDLGAAELVTDEYGKLTQAVSDYARFDFYYGSYTQESTQPASVPEATDGDAVLTWEDIPQNFVFTSGAGAWQTSLDLQPDGSFSGAYSDSNMGESSDANPHGTVYYCNFNGQFTQPQPVTEYCYSVELTEFSAEDSENAEYIDNGIRYVRSEPYGFNDSQCFYLYLPGTPVADLPEDCLYWLNLLQQVESEIPSGMYVIYNQVETAVFVGSLE